MTRKLNVMIKWYQFTIITNIKFLTKKIFYIPFFMTEVAIILLLQLSIIRSYLIIKALNPPKKPI